MPKWPYKKYEICKLDYGAYTGLIRRRTVLLRPVLIRKSRMERRINPSFSEEMTIETLIRNAI